jgi:hypothetical protein
VLVPYHRLITTRALEDLFSPSALQAVVEANLGQDNLGGQLGHDEFHFDNNAFAESRAYIEAQRLLISPALESGNAAAARAAFGRLTHTAQDFYAHSNYIPLWLKRFSEGELPLPARVEPFDSALLASPELRSGRLYYPLEALSFIPALKKFVLPLLPRDSHAWMNLDGPESGPGFDYAFEAAVRATRREYDRTISALSGHLVTLFTGTG